MNDQYIGWIVAIVLAGLGIMKGIWDYLQRKSDNDTKVKLNASSRENLSRETLNKQYTELMEKFDELEVKFSETDKRLQRALDAFDIILPLIKRMIEENPEFKDVVDNALKHLTIN